MEGINIMVCEDVRRAVEEASKYLFDLLKAKPASVLGFATGDTFIPFYDYVSTNFLKSGISFKKAVSFNLDEYVGIRNDSPQSYHHYMMSRFFSKVDIDRANAHLPDGNAGDVQKEAAAYEKMIDDSGGIDIQYLGLGRNGHIGFNEPGTPFDSLTHVVRLTASTKKANAHLFGEEDRVPDYAITMGIRTILKSRRIILIAFGEGKSRAVGDTLTGRITENVPATSLRLHSDVTFILDVKAAEKIL
jgi:glucosamine-6-phosphate deaminase